MSFQERLQRALERGQRENDAHAREKAEKALGEEGLKRLHGGFRLELSEHIESCLAEMANQVPGFTYETVVGDRGWGAAVSQDALAIERGRRKNNYSRLEITVRPFSSAHIIEIAAKGTVHNKEVFHRNQYQLLSEADTTSQVELIDLWVLEFVERFAAAR